jgi:hypothetical protein
VPINRQAARTNYVNGAANNAQKLVDNFVARAGKVDAARSDAAETLFAQRIQQAIAAKSRQKALARVSEADMNAAMTASGASNYRTGTQRGAEKQISRVEPYFAALDSLEGKLPARTADPMQNLMNRAGAVVKVMVETKKRIG